VFRLILEYIIAQGILAPTRVIIIIIIIIIVGLYFI